MLRDKLVEALRNEAQHCVDEGINGWGNLMNEAADHIETNGISKEIRENGCSKAARDGEPVFILLGRDLDAPAAIREWVRERGLRTGTYSDKMRSARDRAAEMEVYQDVMKRPSTSGDGNE